MLCTWVFHRGHADEKLLGDLPVCPALRSTARSLPLRADIPNWREISSLRSCAGRESATRIGPEVVRQDDSEQDIGHRADHERLAGGGHDDDRVNDLTYEAEDALEETYNAKGESSPDEQQLPGRTVSLGPAAPSTRT